MCGRCRVGLPRATGGMGVSLVGCGRGGLDFTGCDGYVVGEIELSVQRVMSILNTCPSSDLLHENLMSTTLTINSRHPP